MSALIANTFGGYPVRHVIEDEPIWIGKDVCDAIGISKYRDALTQLDDDERVSVTVDTPGGPQMMTGVTEAGIWSLMLISRSPHVKTFRRWLTHVVLPEIRRTGSYTSPLTDEEKIHEALSISARRVEELKSKVLELTPPAAAWTELAEAAGDYSVADAAKVLSRDENISIGRDRLFKFMQAEGWIYRRNGAWKAYQSQVDNGRLVEKLARPYWHDGRGEYITPDPTIRVSVKGLAELHKRLGGTGQLALVTAS